MAAVKKAVEGHRSPRRKAFAFDLRMARQRPGVRQSSGALTGAERSAFDQNIESKAEQKL
jgi:hypothetical protein